MNRLITDAEQATPEWLTRVLGEKGDLDRGKVTSAQKSSQSTITSVISHLELSYSDDSPKSAPRRLFLKISKPDAPLGCGEKEVEFYQTVASAMIDPPTVRCYDAVSSPEIGRSHILLDDLSETYFQPERPLPPSKQHCEQVMDCLARFHAFWWDHPRLGKDIEELPTEASEREYIRNLEERLPGFLNFLGDRLSVAKRKLYEKVLSSLPRLSERLTEGKNLTLIHGDAHLWNFLYPHDPDRNNVYIIDWDFWNVNIGSKDLGHAIALHWYPERRRLMESDLIRRYHDELQKHGVENYDWENCWYDYRLSAIDNLFMPIWQWSAKLSPSIWWDKLEKVFLAFQDLECAELLENER